MFAADNDNPTQFKDTEDTNLMFTISVVSDRELIATAVYATTHTIPNYLGCIVSEDRQTIYWVNNTKPLTELGKRTRRNRNSKI